MNRKASYIYTGFPMTRIQTIFCLFFCYHNIVTKSNPVVSYQYQNMKLEISKIFFVPETSSKHT